MPTLIDFSTVQVGTIQPFGGTVAPSGYLLCDGASISRTIYARLFAAIGTAFGTSSGSTFNIPDFRGRFLRGVDSLAGRDPDAGSRTAMFTGGNPGDSVGSVQGHVFASHNHPGSSVAAGCVASGLTAATPFCFPGGGSIALQGGNETRPINAYVNYIIKF